VSVKADPLNVKSRSISCASAYWLLLNYVTASAVGTQALVVCELWMGGSGHSRHCPHRSTNADCAAHRTRP